MRNLTIPLYHHPLEVRVLELDHDSGAIQWELDENNPPLVNALIEKYKGLIFDDIEDAIWLHYNYSQYDAKHRYGLADENLETKE